MNPSVSQRRLPAWKPLALASALFVPFNPTVSAQTTEPPLLVPVVVTASRFANDPALAPIGATVITAAEIRSAGVDNVNQAIRKIGGVYGRQSSDGSQDFDLDLRGFGTNSSQNLVVLVDGVRLSENELSGTRLSSLPVDSVERIEIMRGGNSVLYGDGATGGVIQIITRRPRSGPLRGSITASLAQYGYRDLRASLQQAWDGFALDANLSTQQADNYRENNALRLKYFSGGAEWRSQQGRAGLRIDLARQNSRFAGALSLAQFEANPRQTLTPGDFGATDSDRYVAFVELRQGAWDLAAELSHREKAVNALYVGSYGVSASTYTGQQTQFSPRLRHLGNLAGITHELVTGLDFARWTRLTASSYSQADAAQKSQAAYVRNELKWGQARLALGLRHEVFNKDSIDPAPYSSATYSISQAQNAWELQGSYSLAAQFQLFGKAGQSFRVANVDENSFTAQPNVPLQGQISHDLEFGGSLTNGPDKLDFRLFRHSLSNELFFDPTAGGGYGANVNLDPTRRQGLEVEASTGLAANLRVRAQWQHLSAKFIAGVNQGKQMVMVPENTVSLRLDWLPSDGQSANLGLQWVGGQRYGADFANTCAALIPSYATLDARYARRMGGWELALAGNNLTGKRYFSNAYGCKSGIYPADGRQMKLSARYEF